MTRIQLYTEYVKLIHFKIISTEEKEYRHLGVKAVQFGQFLTHS